MSTNPLWSVLQAYMDSPLHEYGPRPADLARKTGVSEQVLSKWKTKPTLPSPAQLSKVATGTGLPFSYLLEAALHGKGFLPEDMAISVHAVDRDEAMSRKLEALRFAIRKQESAMTGGQMAEFNRHLESLVAAFLEGGDGNGSTAPNRPADSELSAAPDELAPAAKEGLIEESGEFNT